MFEMFMSQSPNRSTRALVTYSKILVIVCLSSYLFSCSTASTGFSHGYTVAQYQGRWWEIKENDTDEISGFQRIQLEKDYDPTIQGLIDVKGLPDYIYVVNNKRIDIAYLAEEKIYDLCKSKYHYYATCLSTIS